MTAKRTISNRLNSRHSTGPSTTAGKRISSQNARQHGLSSKKLPTETEREVGSLAAMLSAATGAEPSIAARSAADIVRRQQIDRIREHMVRKAFVAAQANPLFAEYPVEVLEDIALISVAAELLRLDDYERRSISKFYKSMRQL